MGFLKILLLAGISGLVFYSCNPCNYLKCAGDNIYGRFRITSAVDGKDLVFGQNSIYDKDDIRFYSLNGSDTIFFDYKNIEFRGDGYDSILHVQFFPKADTAFMLLSDGDIDTIKLSYRKVDSKCCGITTEISNYRFNDKFDLPGSNGTQEIKK